MRGGESSGSRSASLLISRGKALTAVEAVWPPLKVITTPADPGRSFELFDTGMFWFFRFRHYHLTLLLC
jgi:hypothetical protein